MRLTPRGGRDAIDGIERLADGRVILKARVRAVPEAGEANTALLRLIAKTAGIPPSSASVSAGQTSRIKTLDLDGDAPRLIEALTAALAKGR